MAQHDYDIANASGAAVRSDINSVLQAVATLNSGAGVPGTTFAHQLWADTTNGVLKQRNTANTAWIVRGSLDAMGVLAKSANYTVALADFGKTVEATGTITLAFQPAATLTDGFAVHVRNAGTGLVTLDPDGAETIDGAATIAALPGEAFTVVCDGANLRTVGRARGLVLLDAKSASASASLDFTALIGGAFDVYAFQVVNLVPATNGANLYARVSQDAGSTWKAGASDYRHAGAFWTSTPSSGATGGLGSEIVLTSALSSSASHGGASGWIHVARPATLTLLKQFTSELSHFDGTPTYYRMTSGGAYTADGNAIDGVRFLMSSGNITSGTVRLFGVRD
jgi:hypothetical protein